MKIIFNSCVYKINRWFRCNTPHITIGFVFLVHALYYFEYLRILLQSSRKLDADPFLKSLKVFRLKAAISGLQFVKSMMFNCSYFDKSILNDYSPMSPKMFLGPGVGQRLSNGAHSNGVHPNGAHPNGAHPNSAYPNNLPRSPPDDPSLPWSPPVSSSDCRKSCLFSMKNNEKWFYDWKRTNGRKQKTESESWGLPLMNGGLKNV